jgi:ATPase subunit of ABC transporter with duplicated ATPase domains
VVYGPTGNGKTTLLANKLEQLYPDHITTRCAAGTTFETLLQSAFDGLNVYFSSTASIKKSRSINAKLQTDYFWNQVGARGDSLERSSSESDKASPFSAYTATRC